MVNSTYIKCANCGVFNTNKDYCENCGELISYKKKQEIRAKEIKDKEVAEAIKEIENPNLPKRLMKNPNFLVKILGWLLHSVWLVVSAIAAGLAWFVAMVAAG